MGVRGLGGGGGGGGDSVVGGDWGRRVSDIFNLQQHVHQSSLTGNWTPFEPKLLLVQIPRAHVMMENVP